MADVDEETDDEVAGRASTYDFMGEVRRLLRERAPDVYAEYMRLVALAVASGSSDGR